MLDAFGETQGGGAVRRMNPGSGVLQRFDGLVELCELSTTEIQIRTIRGRKMCPEPFESYVAGHLEPTNYANGVPAWDSDTVHAGLDFDVSAEGSLVRRDNVFGDLFRGDGDVQVVFTVKVNIVRKRRSEDKDSTFDSRLPESDALGYGRDGKPRNSRF
jgi:hypothetical protein